MHRVSLGKNQNSDGHEQFVISDASVSGSSPNRMNLTVSVYAVAVTTSGDMLQLPMLSDGSVPIVKVTTVIPTISTIETEIIHINGSIPGTTTLRAELNNRSFVNLSLTERQMTDEYGLRVSRPGANVLDPVHARTGNLAFDSSDYIMGSLRVLQTGTFQIQCKKTYFGKKGGLEILSDEQARANADYIKKYPMELEHMDNSEYTQHPEVNSGVYGYDTGQGTYTGNNYNSEYVQNVYCDYGSQTIEFNPPLPNNIKTPFISVHFALANSSGHFHPWYANVTCTPGEEDYQWKYANSQHCVHMDSAWFRGKWAFRDRSFNPYGDLLNLDYRPSWNADRDTLDKKNSLRSKNWDIEGYTATGGGQVLAHRTTQYKNHPRESVHGGTGPEESRHIMKMRGSGDWIYRKDQYNYKYTPDNTEAMGGMAVKKYANHLIQDVHRFEDKILPKREAFEFDGDSRNDNEKIRDSKHYTIGPSQTGSEAVTGFEETEVKENSPAALWGGIFKSFAGLQGLTYYANTTHLTIDGFLTPTHSPTPFETEIVKTREVNPNAAHGDMNKFNWHNGKYLGEWNESFDRFGQIRKNVGWDANMIFGADGSRYPYTPHLGNGEEVKYAPWDFDDVAYVANKHGYGLDYVEKLPRKFRTKYWDGSQTEYEWWPIGHANGHFTIATGLYEDSSTATPNTSLVGVAEENHTTIMRQMLRLDANNRGFSDKDVKILGAAKDDERVNYAATYGDYSPIATFGRDHQSWNRHGQNKEESSPFNAFINKGTRFSNQLPNTEGKGYPPNSQYEPGDAFLKTRTFQGQPTSLDSFWNSFSNNTSQWVSSNTPYGEFYYADGGYAMDLASYYNYGGGKFPYGAVSAKGTIVDGTKKYHLVKFMPSDWNIQRQSFAKHNWDGGNPKAGVGTEGRRFGFGGAGSSDALGGEGEGVFDTYIGRYIIYDIEGGGFGE